MRLYLTTVFSLLQALVFGQSLQLHYDVRHYVAPKRNPKNFPTLYFEFFKQIDSGKNFIKLGSFLLKTQADFNGDKNNLGKFYMQVSQEVRFWKNAKLYVNLQYSGGLGVTNPRQYSFYILNTYSLGVSYHYKIGNSYLSSMINYRYVPYAKPSKDFLYTMFFYHGFFNYRAEISGNFSVWTENKNRGDSLTANLKGKRFYFFAEPQAWYTIYRKLAVGTKINMYYHVNTLDKLLEIYPTIALRIKI